MMAATQKSVQPGQPSGFVRPGEGLAFSPPDSRGEGIPYPIKDETPGAAVDAGCSYSAGFRHPARRPPGTCCLASWPACAHQEDDEITAGSGTTREERRRHPSRVLALTDGVFAIIITLLVLDIHVPELSVHEKLGTAIVEVRPSFISFVIAFIVAAMQWVGHRDLFTLIRSASRPAHPLPAMNRLLALVVFCDRPGFSRLCRCAHVGGISGRDRRR
jgi:Endosomal/lysosomal potassium channel TMEM175